MNITKGEIEAFKTIYEKIVNEVDGVLEKLYEVNPRNYLKSCLCEYLSVDDGSIIIGGFGAHSGYYDWEQQRIPLKYLYDEEVIKELEAEIKEKKRLNEEGDNETLKRVQEQDERKEYERLKKKFEGGV